MFFYVIIWLIWHRVLSEYLSIPIYSLRRFSSFEIIFYPIICSSLIFWKLWSLFCKWNQMKQRHTKFTIVFRCLIMKRLIKIFIVTLFAFNNRRTVKNWILCRFICVFLRWKSSIEFQEWTLKMQFCSPWPCLNDKINFRSFNNNRKNKNNKNINKNKNYNYNKQQIINTEDLRMGKEK